MTMRISSLIYTDLLISYNLIRTDLYKVTVQIIEKFLVHMSPESTHSAHEVITMERVGKRHSVHHILGVNRTS